MGALAESRASLRLFGDDLDPDEITRLLGKEPTASERKGQVIRRPNGQERTARTGSWRLQAKDRQPEDLDGQVEEILSGLTDNLETWTLLASKYQLDLFCGLFLRDGNEGVEISAPTLLALGQRGITIGFDIYAPTAPEDSNQ